MPIETIEVPRYAVSLADRRTRDIIRASVNYPDALRVIARSAYLQGLEDGAEVARAHQSQEIPNE